MLYKQLMNLNFIVVIYSSYLIARMSSAGFSPPSMNWEAPNVAEEFRRFKQYCELIFDGSFSNKSKKERISFILLWIGGPRVDIYNSWSWEDEAKKAKPEKILGRFEKHVSITTIPTKT